MLIYEGKSSQWRHNYTSVEKISKNMYEVGAKSCKKNRRI